MAIFDGPDQLMEEAENQQLLEISKENEDYPVITVIQIKEMIKFLEAVMEETDNENERDFAFQTATQLRCIDRHASVISEVALKKMESETGEMFIPDDNGPILSFVPMNSLMGKKLFGTEKNKVQEYEKPDDFLKRCFDDNGKR